MNKLVNILTFGMLCACSVVNNNSGDGETGGEIPLSEGPQEGANPPEWVCRERAPLVTLAGYDAPMRELERCPFAPHAKDYDGDGQIEQEPWGWPGKPYWLGIPTVMHWTDGSNWQAGAHPAYQWYGQGNTATLFKKSVTNPWLPEESHDFRSGLVGNFALWIGGVPSVAPRPPIVTASFIDVTNFDLPTIFGHPFYEGRYNAYGSPCSTNPPDQTPGNNWALLLTSYGFLADADCHAWVEWYGVEHAHALYPMVIDDDDAMIGIAQDNSQCLDNGGVYKVSEAALTAVNRGGLIWINWGEFWEDFVAWIQAQHPELHAVIVALDYLQNAGWEGWPTDPPYPYANWSVTGVCSHGVALRRYPDDTIRTAVPCPVGMLPVLPDLGPNYLDEYDDPEDVHGYCTFPHQLDVPPGVANTTPLDVVSTGKPGSGFAGAKYVDLAALTSDDLRDWGDALDLDLTPIGITVTANSQPGRDVLDAFSVPDGSAIVGVNSLVTLESSTGGITLADVALEIDRAIAAHEFVWLLIDAPDGSRLHRYVVPHWGE